MSMWEDAWLAQIADTYLRWEMGVFTSIYDQSSSAFRNEIVSSPAARLGDIAARRRVLIVPIPVVIISGTVRVLIIIASISNKKVGANLNARENDLLTCWNSGSHSLGHRNESSNDYPVGQCVQSV